MVELKVYLSDGLNEKFRRLAMTVYGYGRGSLSRAAEEAFANWCAEHDGASRKVNTSSSVETVSKQTAPPASGINPDERSRDSEKPHARVNDGSLSNSAHDVSMSGDSPVSQSQNISISRKPDNSDEVVFHG